jgi:hypothetical protein
VLGALWEVSVLSALVSDRPGGWDPDLLGEEAPDPYVVVNVGGIVGETAFVGDTYSPSFDERVLTASASDLVGRELACEVGDYDGLFGWPSDLIGQCRMSEPITLATLKRGRLTLTHCTGYAQQVTIRFTAM